MNPQHEDFICFYREAVIAGHDAPAAETMRRFNLSRDYTVRLLNGAIAGLRWSRYPKLESFSEKRENANLSEPQTRLQRCNGAHYPEIDACVFITRQAIRATRPRVRRSRYDPVRRMILLRMAREWMDDATAIASTLQEPETTGSRAFSGNRAA